MATLTIRNLPDPVRNALRVRAAQRGRSVEAEVRAVLEESVRAPTPANWRKTIAEIQARATIALNAAHAPTDWSLGEEFLTWRRLEFMAEEGLASAAELAALEDRLRRFDLRLDEVESLLAARGPAPSL